MKFTLAWLYEHLETQASLAEICDRLNMIGLEVEDVIDPSVSLAKFTVAEIIKVKPHPNADKLKICTIKTDTATQEVVCGAPNARIGLKTILAHEGAVIPSNGMILRKTKIRDVESCGMLCSAAELGLSDDHETIIELADNVAIGAAAADVLGAMDPVIDIAITPNRPDCLAVYGIARDLAAAGLGVLKTDFAQKKPYDLTDAPAGDFDCPISIAVETPACPVFAGCVIRGVKNIPSPDWLAHRLTAIGLRPINALVDITNYIAYDYGRPLHVYDIAKLNGSIVVRAGKAGEKFTALNEKEYEVTADDCVIADAQHILGFGGVMGGLDAGTTLDTTDVLVESAWFNPIAIADTGRRHNIESDARTRFERGVDPQSVTTGLNLAIQMIMKLCGGQPSRPVIAGAIPDGTKQIDFATSCVQSLTGIALPDDEIIAILTRLGFIVKKGKADSLSVIRPSWRPDIEGAADLVEEITRIHGLDKVPCVPLPRAQTAARPVLSPNRQRLALARHLLASRGMVETVTWSFIPEKYAHYFGGQKELKLSNPVSSEMSNMRPSLLPGLLMAAARNMDRGHADLAFFEVGQEFTKLETGGQRMAVAGLRCGNRNPRHWAHKTESVNIFDAKTDAESLLAAYGLNCDDLLVKRETPDWYHPGRSAILCQDPHTILAMFGEIHPAILKAFNLTAPMVAFELYPAHLPCPQKAKSRTKPPFAASNLQPVRRDFAFEVAEHITADTLIRTAYAVNKKLITHVGLFDAFTSDQMAKGVKSLAIEVTLQPQDTSLTDTQIEEVSAQLIAKVEKATGGKLRR